MGTHRAWNLVLAAGCVAASACRPTPVRRALTLAVQADVTGVFPNPPIDTESHTFDVNSNMFEGLVRFDRSLNPEPALAERWENPDETTWVFHLRKGLRFSDGSAVTASDVVSSLQAARHRGWPTGVFLQAVGTIRARDADTVEIRTRVPYPILLSKLQYGFVLPGGSVDRSPVPPVGTGPYRFVRWTPGRELVLERNPHFRDPAAAYDTLRFVVVPDAQERIRRVQAGEADAADGVPLSAIDALSQDSRVRIRSAPGLRVIFLAFRVDRRPFSDPRLREAVDLAIDRKELIRRALEGKAVPATELVTPMVAGYSTSVGGRATDPERARRLLAEAGFPRGMFVRLDGPNNRYAGDTAILREVSRQLGAVGIRAEPNPLPKGEFFRLVESGKSDFYLLGWACETRDAGDALDALMHSRTATGLGSANDEGIADAPLDGLIDRANASPALSLRNGALSQAVARVAELHAVVPLEIQTEAVVTSPGLRWEPPINFGLRLLTK
jgi:peptide/nickel transport system substrate-binding protein